MAREQRDNPTRRRILKAARRLFSSRGYDAVSITDLADAARVNRAALYYYFEDKRDLYREAIKTILDLIPALWERRETREGAPAQKLDKYVTGLWEALASNRDAMPLIMREVATGGPERELIFKRYLVPNAVHVAAILEEGMARGEFADAPPLMAAVAVLSGMIMPNFGLAVGRPFLDEAGGLLPEGRAYVDFYRGYVRRALGPPAGKGGSKRAKNE